MSYLWSPEEEEVYKKMLEANCSEGEIKSVLKGRTDEALEKKARKMGLKYKKRMCADIDYEVFKKIMGSKIKEI